MPLEANRFLGRMGVGLPSLLLAAGLALGPLVRSAASEVQQMPALRVNASPLGLIGLTMTLDVAGSSPDPAQQPIRSLVVKSVLAGSPAERAGFHPKDAILTIDGHVTPGMSRADLQELIGSKNVGDPIAFEVTGYKSPVKRSIALTVGRGQATPLTK